MKIARTLPLLLALAACRQAPQAVEETVPTKEVVAGAAMIDFDSSEAAFSCLAPADWGQLEKQIDKDKGAVFIGPRDPKKQASATITILRYPASEPRYNDARKYAETFWELDPKGGQPAIETKTIGDHSVLTFHQELPNRKVHGSPNIDYQVRTDYALFPVKGGFFAIQHRAPADSFRKTLPIFDAVVSSFKPKG